MSAPMRSNKTCAVPLCNNRQGVNGISLHKFPSDKKYRALWARLFRLRVLTRNHFVCSAHFEPSCFYFSSELSNVPRKRVKMKRDAIPSLKLPDKHYAQTYEGRKKELRKIQKIKYWRVKNNLDLDSLPNLIKFPPPDPEEDGVPPLRWSDLVSDEETPQEEDQCANLENEDSPIETLTISESEGTSGEESNCRTYCSVPNCKTYASPDFCMHLFPKDKIESRKWKKALKIRKQITPYMVVCGKHFKSSDYIPTKVGQKPMRLKKYAVPSVNLPVMSREASSSVEKRLREIADEHAKMMFTFCPKDKIIRNECFLKLQTKISGLHYIPRLNSIKQKISESTLQAVEERLSLLKKQNEMQLMIKQEKLSDDESHPLNNDNHNDGSGTFKGDITYEKIQEEELLKDMLEEDGESDSDGYSPLEMSSQHNIVPSDILTVNDTQIKKRSMSDEELVRLFLTNASLIKKFLKDDKSIQKYLDVAETVRKDLGKEQPIPPVASPIIIKPPRGDDHSIFGDFVAAKLRRMPGPEHRKQFQDWIHQGLSIMENTNYVE